MTLKPPFLPGPWDASIPPWADTGLGLGPTQVDQLKLKVSRLEEECVLLRRARGPLPAPATAASAVTSEEREREVDDGPDLVSELRAENQRLTASLQELQEGLQQVWFDGGADARAGPQPPTEGSGTEH